MTSESITQVDSHGRQRVPICVASAWGWSDSNIFSSKTTRSAFPRKASMLSFASPASFVCSWFGFYSTSASHPLGSCANLLWQQVLHSSGMLQALVVTGAPKQSPEITALTSANTEVHFSEIACNVGQMQILHTKHINVKTWRVRKHMLPTPSEFTAGDTVVKRWCS